MEMILLTILCVILSGVAGYLGFELFKTKKSIASLKTTNEEYSRALEEGQKAVELALKYEEFYSSTVGDIGQIVDALGAVIGKRQVLSDDPDVQNLVRLLAIAHDTLLGYINAKLPTEENAETTGPEEPQPKQY